MPPREAERRERVERREQWRDRQERYVTELELAESDDERRALQARFAEDRRTYRLEREARGEGPGIAMDSVLWSQWLRIAVANELASREAFKDLVEGDGSDPLGRELRTAMVCIAACTSAIEGVYGDLVYRLPCRPEVRTRHKQVDRAAAKAAFNDFLDDKRYSRNQIEFVNLIIDYLTLHGAIQPRRIYDSPFTGVAPQGPEDLFGTADVDRIFEVIEELTRTAA